MSGIDIGFCDMSRDFDVNDNMFVKALKKNNIDYHISDNPKVLFYSVFEFIGFSDEFYKNSNIYEIIKGY